MKCNNCGYEIEKPNLKTCPLCGNRIIAGAQSSDDKTVSEEPVTVPPQSPALEESETTAPTKPEIYDEEELILEVEESDVYPAQEPVLSEPPVVERQSPAPDPVTPPIYNAPVAQAPEPVTIPTTYDERITPEDPDEYLENGSYQPYPDEADDESSYDDGSYPQGGEKSSSSWIAIVIAALGGLLIGSLLYFSI
ncbi:MAG: hypothetical protein K2M05_07890 [Paramuribaculum sp.]|nr:hypothetical protein [Paramuribaculum sp.]